MLSDKLWFRGDTSSRRTQSSTFVEHITSAREADEGREWSDLSFKGSNSRGQTGKMGPGNPHSIRAHRTSGCHSWSSFCVQEFTGIIPLPHNDLVGRSSPNFKHKGNKLKQGIWPQVTRLLNVQAGIHPWASQAPNPVLFLLFLTSSVKTLRQR